MICGTSGLIESALAAPSYDQAAKLYSEKKYREALPMFIEIVKTEPRNSSSYFLMANCYYMLSDRTTAARLYRTLIASFPGSLAAQSAQKMLQSLESANKGAGAGASPASGAKTDISSRIIEDSTASKGAADVDARKLLVVVRPLRDHPAVSDATVDNITRAMNGLPPKFLQLLVVNGARIYLTPSMYDKNPELTNTEGRGYHGGTYKTCPGMFYGTQIVICERTMEEDGLTLTEQRAAQDILNTFYHECGHAIDSFSDDITETEEYKHTYRLDAAKIEPETAKRLQYYLQKAEGGPSESCAELIGLLLGAKKAHGDLMLASFPETTKLLKMKLGF